MLELEMEKPMSRHSRSQTWAIIYMRKPHTGVRNKGCLQAWDYLLIYLHI